MNGASQKIAAVRDWLSANTWVGALLFSALAAVLLAVHLFSKSVRMDYPGLVLLALIAAPWVLNRIAHVKAGDFEVDLRDLQQSLEEVRTESTDAAQNELPGEPAAAVMAEQQVLPPLTGRDFPSLAFELRLAIEQEIRKLAAAAGILFGGGRVAVSRAIRTLADHGALPWDVAGALLDLVPLLSQGVHGEQVAQETLEWLTREGRATVDALARYVVRYRAQASQLEAAINAYAESAVAETMAIRIRGIRWARDREGTWWATAVISAADRSLEDAAVIMRRDLDQPWQGVSLGTGLDEDELPPEVRGVLWATRD